MRFSRMKFCLILITVFISSCVSECVCGSSEARFLQAKTSCPVDFEHQNYTIITSKCRGPDYPPSLCCDALKEFACPFAEELNDLSNDCASTMFSYITSSGQYPKGLFANTCRDTQEGLSCPQLAPQSQRSNADNTPALQLPLLMIIFGTLPFI